MFDIYCAGSARTRNSAIQKQGELLENRVMLTGVPPAVADVAVSSSQWTTDFKDYLQNQGLGNDGYSIPVGSAAQLTPLTWFNIDQIRITFTEDVEVDRSDLSLSGAKTTAYAFSQFSYDPQSFVAVWTLSQPLVSDNLLLDLDSDGMGPVIDADGNLLDGEWTTSVSSSNSGDGTEGGDFEFRFSVLPGDVSASGGISSIDYIQTAMLYGKGTADAGYDPLKDIDGSGTIDTDYQQVFAAIGDSLPTADPAGMTNDPPTTSGLADMTLSAVDAVLSLWDYFGDAEDSKSEMTYSVASNSNPNLFDSVSYNPENGQLSFEFPVDSQGAADLVILATDSNGLTVEAPLHIEFDYVNIAPVISDLSFFYHDYDTWTISGVVTDPDHDVEGFVVVFSGVYTGSTTVQADGTFEITVILPPSTYGWLNAKTEDDEEAESNVASCFIIGT